MTLLQAYWLTCKPRADRLPSNGKLQNTHRRSTLCCWSRSPPHTRTPRRHTWSCPHTRGCSSSSLQHRQLQTNTDSHTLSSLTNTSDDVMQFQQGTCSAVQTQATSSTTTVPSRKRTLPWKRQRHNQSPPHPEIFISTLGQVWATSDFLVLPKTYGAFPTRTTLL